MFQTLIEHALSTNPSVTDCEVIASGWIIRSKCCISINIYILCIYSAMLHTKTSNKVFELNENIYEPKVNIWWSNWTVLSDRYKFYLQKSCLRAPARSLIDMLFFYWMGTINSCISQTFDSRVLRTWNSRILQTFDSRLLRTLTSVLYISWINIRGSKWGLVLFAHIF